MGRRSKSDPRNQQLNLSLPASELEAIRKRAEAVGMRSVHFGRAILLGGEGATCTRQAAPATHLNMLMIDQLRRLGNLLNQLMRHLHRTGDPLPPDLEPLLKDIRKIIARGYGDDR